MIKVFFISTYFKKMHFFLWVTLQLQQILPILKGETFTYSNCLHLWHRKSYSSDFKHTSITCKPNIPLTLCVQPGSLLAFTNHALVEDRVTTFTLSSIQHISHYSSPTHRLIPSVLPYSMTDPENVASSK
jgi:hypothetical protein